MIQCIKIFSINPLPSILLTVCLLLIIYHLYTPSQLQPLTPILSSTATTTTDRSTDDGVSTSTCTPDYHLRLLSAYKHNSVYWQNNVVQYENELRGNTELLQSMNRSYCSSANGLNDSDVNGTWYIPSDDNTLYYDLYSCRLRRPTVSQVKKCLSNQSLYFVGDSITRYQYMSLIYYMSNGVWPEDYGSLYNTPNPLIETEWADWNTYFNASQTMFNGKEICHGYRIPNNTNSHHERRHYIDSFNQHDVGTNIASNNIHIRMVTSGTQIGMQRHLYDILDERNPSSNRSDSTYLYNADILNPIACVNASIPDTTCSRYSAVTPTTVLIVNFGLWNYVDATDKIKMRKYIFDTIKSYNNHRTIIPFRALYKTTTPVSYGGDDIVADMYHTAKQLVHNEYSSQWELFDIYRIVNHTYVRRSYFDTFHYLPFIHRELNIYLLNTLCDQDWSFISHHVT